MQKLVILANTFSDLNRVEILSLLKREHELCVFEICDTLELSQPLVSRHLKKDGKWIIYKLAQDKTLHYLLSTIEDR
ncbi:MAG: ArsR family transcriptional regulator [Sulfurimonas sp.]|nr:ArsR family transcriptional regulator [Sulfurimonas sp.]